MKLEKIISNPQESLNYMERLVNNGSPSGFSFINTSSPQTSPLCVSEYNICSLSKDVNSVKTIGVIPNLIKEKYSDVFFVHPDWKLVANNYNIIDSDILVIPTASCRTVKLAKDDYYIKMCYPGILGRISRELQYEHILSSIDINNILKKLIMSNGSPKKLAFFPEYGGKIYHHQERIMGFVIRDANPIGHNVRDITALIPAFSLYSDDINNKDDTPIIIQLLNYKPNKIEFLLNELFFPIIDCYYFCVFNGGIQPEMHSQNFLIGINNHYDIVSIVLRDLESFDKDINYLTKVYPDLKIKSYPYKCIDSMQYNYQIKHSFMFDHKLGEYFLDEIISCLAKHNIVEKGQLENEIKKYVNENYGQRLIDFFPSNNCCYRFKKVIIDRKKTARPYETFCPPKYR